MYKLEHSGTWKYIMRWTGNLDSNKLNSWQIFFIFLIKHEKIPICQWHSHIWQSWFVSPQHPPDPQAEEQRGPEQRLLILSNNRYMMHWIVWWDSSLTVLWNVFQVQRFVLNLSNSVFPINIPRKAKLRISPNINPAKQDFCETQSIILLTGFHFHDCTAFFFLKYKHKEHLVNKIF